MSARNEEATLEDPAIIRINREHYRTLLLIERDRTKREIIKQRLAEQDAMLDELGLGDEPERRQA